METRSPATRPTRPSASRLAPTDEIVVGERTWQATRDVFEFEELEPAELKGKAERTRAFRVLAPKARFGLDLIRTRGTTSCRPGDGARRAARLLRRRARLQFAPARDGRRRAWSRQEPARRRAVRFAGGASGRADHVAPGPLPALRGGDHVLAAGRDREGARRHPRHRPRRGGRAEAGRGAPRGDQRAWLRASATASRNRSRLRRARELSALPARFLEYIASLQGPAVLVFEDLHWADEAMLAFLEHAAEQLDNVPLLLLGTARPSSRNGTRTSGGV